MCTQVRSVELCVSSVARKIDNRRLSKIVHCARSRCKDVDCAMAKYYGNAFLFLFFISFFYADNASSLSEKC